VYGAQRATSPSPISTYRNVAKAQAKGNPHGTQAALTPEGIRRTWLNLPHYRRARNPRTGGSILASNSFRRLRNFKHLLEYLVAETIAGRASQLTQKKIAADVFDLKDSLTHSRKWRFEFPPAGFALRSKVLQTEARPTSSAFTCTRPLLRRPLTVNVAARDSLDTSKKISQTISWRARPSI